MDRNRIAKVRIERQPQQAMLFENGVE
jgi:hypothetical protein